LGVARDACTSRRLDTRSAVHRGGDGARTNNRRTRLDLTHLYTFMIEGRLLRQSPGRSLD